MWNIFIVTCSYVLRIFDQDTANHFPLVPLLISQYKHSKRDIVRAKQCSAPWTFSQCICILLSAFFWNTYWYFYWVSKVFDESSGESNTEKTSKNINQYFKRRHLIIYLLSNHKIWKRSGWKFTKSKNLHESPKLDSKNHHISSILDRG